MRKQLIAAVAATMLGGGAAHATTFDPTFYAEGIGPIFNLSAGTLSQFGVTATADFEGTPIVSVSGGPGMPPFDANAVARWEFQVSGTGPVGEMVPIVVSGVYSLSTSGDGGSISADVVEYTDAIHFHTLFQDFSFAGSNLLTSQPYTIHTTVEANALQQIEISLDGSVASGGFGAFSGFVDPMISFDLGSGFDFSHYTLEVAPDALPTPGGGGVPEPGTWGLMLLGFGAAGVALRRRAALV